MQDNELRWQDEILQVMYWMRGEHLGQEVTSTGLARFLNLEPEQLERALDRLVAAGLIAMSTTGDSSSEAFELSERGVEEGKRRFQEEFSPLLARPSHMRCDDPTCDCYGEDWDGACSSMAGDS